MLRIITKNARETYELGVKLGRLLSSGDIVCLTGDLGAGKTAFTKGIGIGLGVVGYITSPTYTIINEYSGRVPLYHFDVYRLESSEEMKELGYEEYFNGDGVVVLEWADMVKDLIPIERIWITILKEEDDNARKILIEPTGDRYNEIVRGVE